ncbi:MAG: Fe-S-containing protein [Deltaproteobacteria bacterium]|nr:Fe-S-containing protein [Deltaproteobacteria bacterium]
MGTEEWKKKVMNYGNKRVALWFGIEERAVIFHQLVRSKTLPLIAVLVVAVLGTWAVFGGGNRGGGPVENFRMVPMTKIEAVTAKGLVEVPMEEVRKNKLVSFEYTRRDGAIPLLAYITPAGKIVTAVGFSELCHSKGFHLEGNDIVCDTCSTHWDLETLQGSSGECPAYPPEMLMHTVHGGRLIIKEVDLKNWKPRIARSYKHATA